MSQEWESQNSLTSPADKVQNPSSVSYNLGATLSEEDVKNAMKELNVDTFTKTFPRVEKFYADPPLSNQNFSLISFVPAKGATPDSDGVYGMVKVRGTFATSDEANLRAEYLIRNVDSYHSIYHTYVGRPFPLATSRKYITETHEVDVKKKVVESTSEEIRKKRDEERQVMKEIEQRQEELLKDVDEKKVEDPHETYTELMVKKAQLSWTYSETLKKMEEMKKSIIKTREQLKSMDEDNSEYRKTYMDRYMEARRKAGLPDNDQSFIKYMAEDLDLGF